MRENGAPSTRAVLEGLTRTIHTTFKYKGRHEKGIQDPLVTLKSGSGSCRDLAMFMIEAVRSLGMAARFVSGYLHVGGHSENHNRGGNTHAWLQVYVPGNGWFDFDPSCGSVGNPRPRARRGCTRSLSGDTSVRRLDRKPRRLFGDDSRGAPQHRRWRRQAAHRRPSLTLTRDACTHAVQRLRGLDFSRLASVSAPNP